MPFTCLSKTSTFQSDRKPSSRNAKDGNNCSWSCGTRISWKLCTVLALWKQWPYFVSLSSSKSVLIRCFFLASFPQENHPTFFHLPLLADGPWRYCGQMKEDVSAWNGMGRKSKSESVEKKKRESQSLTFSLFSECLFHNCLRNHVRENGIISFSCLRKCLSVLFAFEVNKRENVLRKRTDLIFF